MNNNILLIDLGVDFISYLKSNVFIRYLNPDSDSIAISNPSFLHAIGGEVQGLNQQNIGFGKMRKKPRIEILLTHPRIGIEYPRNSNSCVFNPSEQNSNLQRVGKIVFSSIVKTRQVLSAPIANTTQVMSV